MLAKVARRFAGYGVNLAVTAVLSLLLIPLIISGAGEDGWAAVALGQAIGAVASVVIAYGWGFHGPSTVAMNRESRATVSGEILESTKLRLILSIPVFAIGIGVSALVSPGNGALAAWGFASIAVLGLRMNWVFIGLGDTRLLLTLETIPRSLGLLAAILIMSSSQSVISALAAQAAGSLCAFAATLMWNHVRSGGDHTQLRSTRYLLRANAHGVSGLTVAAVWVSLPAIVISILAPQMLASFALVMRVYAQGCTAISPVVDILQGWVPSKDRSTVVRRATRAIKVAIAAGAAVAIAYIAVSTPLYNFLGAGVVTPKLPEVLLSGAALTLWVTSQTVSRCALAPLGMQEQFAKIVYIAVAAGVTTLLLTVASLGSTGGLLSIVVWASLQTTMGGLVFLRARRQRENP